MRLVADSSTQERMTRQYYPLPGEYVATGIIGILLYLLIIYFSVDSVKMGIKSKSTKRFFFCLIVMALFELPRFMAMAVQGDYNSEVAYCFHIFAGVFFFAAFSLVCRQWSGLLQLGSYFRAVYGRQGLIISNVLFAIVDLVAVIACATAPSLSSFFSSTGFEVITFIEGVRNCVYSIFLAFYGIKLVKRFWKFSRIERQSTAHKSIFAYMVYWEPIGDQDAVFTKVVLRMTSVLVLSSACYICRVGMLIAKMVAVHSSHCITSRTFTLFGFLWFCCSDFIPRTLPTIAFIFLMRTKKPAGDIRHSARHKQSPEGDDFQFVQLADDESFYNLSDLDRSNSISSATEVMLNADLFVPDSKRSLNPADTYVNGMHSSHSGAVLHNFTASNAGANAGTGAGSGAGAGSRQQSPAHTAGHTLLTRIDADDDTNDDDFYSLDDEEWNNGEPSLIDKFFSAITFSATQRPETRDPKSKGKDGSYDATQMRL